MDRNSIVVYAGKGSSHSWTWLADLFEKNGITDVRFVNTKTFTEELTDSAKAIVISGGDGHEIASAIGAHGFSHLSGFIHRGGRYVGICAGAYLPLNSSVHPFNKFNISPTKIENIECDPRRVDDGAPRKSVRYGSCAIIHPVRGEMEIETDQAAFPAPLYGGPVFREPTSDMVLARYRSFTRGTEFQIDKARADAMMLRKPAAVKTRHGHGELVLFGPHLEHPRYPLANAHFMRFIGAEGVPNYPPVTPSSGEPYDFLAHALADLKVAILGLENRSFLVGNKMWDGGRFLELVNAMDDRLNTVGEPLAGEVTLNLMLVREELRKASSEELLYADEGPERLVETARLVVDNHFRVLRESRNR